MGRCYVARRFIAGRYLPGGRARPRRRRARRPIDRHAHRSVEQPDPPARRPARRDDRRAGGPRPLRPRRGGARPRQGQPRRRRGARRRALLRLARGPAPPRGRGASSRRSPPTSSSSTWPRKQERVRVLRSGAAREAAAAAAPSAETSPPPSASCASRRRRRASRCRRSSTGCSSSPSSPRTRPRPSAARSSPSSRRIADVLRRLRLRRADPRGGARRARRAARGDRLALADGRDAACASPDVLDEVRNGLYFFDDVLFDLAPVLYRSARRRAGRALPRRRRSQLPPFLRFGSWIGGDRDGNPFVTVAVTEETLREHKELALRLYQRGLDRMHGHLSTSERYGVDATLCEPASSATPRSSPTRRGASTSATPCSPTARRCAYVYRKLARHARGEPRGRGAPTTCPRPGTYRRRRRVHRRPAPAAGEPARAPAASGWPTGGSAPSSARPRSSASTWRPSTCASTPTATRPRSTEVFAPLRPRRGLRRAARGRQGARCSPREMLGRPAARRPPQLDFSAETNETLELFRLVRRAHERVGPRCRRELHHQHDDAAPSDVLAVLLMAQDAGVADRLDIVPLFETVADLHAAPRDHGALFANPAYAGAPRPPRRRPAGHARLQRLEQGRRLPDRQLGAAPRAARPARGLPAATASA